MRVLAAILLSVFAAFAAELHAQSCAQLVSVERIRATSANCTNVGDSEIRCRPDAPSTLVADVSWSFSSSAPHCATRFQWNFNDGTPAVITTEPTVQHTFAAVSGVNAVYPIGVWAIEPGRGASATLRPIWGSISVARLTQTAREGSIPGRIAITRTDATQPVTVGYSVSSEPAAYVEAHEASVTFAAGEMHKEIEIPIRNDAVYNGNGYALVNLLTAPGGWRFEMSRTSFKIEDDDAETRYAFARDRFGVSESAGSVTLEIVRSGASDFADTVDVRLSRALTPGGATSYAVPFAAGQTSATLPIAVANDSLWGLSIESHVTAASRRTPALADAATIVVTEDEPTPRLATRVIEIPETDATRVVSIPLDWTPNFAVGLTLYAMTADGTATKSRDYETVSRYVSFPADSIGITITGDDTPESDETFTITFGGAVTDTMTIRILDDDRPPSDFQFESDSYAFPEAGGTVGVRRSGNTAIPATATLRVAGRTPAAWTIAPITLSFAAGETTKQVTLATDDDWFTNGREGTLELESNGFVSAFAELTLREDETMPLLTVSDADALEGANAEFVLSLSGRVGADIFVNVSTEPGTATAADYTPLVAKQVHIPSGTTLIKVPVAVHADGITEGNESFTLNVASCCGGFAQLANATATATIRESGAPPDGASYKLEAPATVLEADDWLTVIVTRRGDTSGRSVATVTLTADEARKFEPVTLFFAPRETKKNVRFAIDDRYRSGDSVALLEVFAGTRGDDKREVTIREDEPPSAIRILDVTVHEPAEAQLGTATFLVTIDPPSFKPIDVELSSAAGTARVNLEFLPVSGIRRIPSLATRMEIPVTIYGDSIVEATETFSVSLRTWAQPGVAATVADDSATAFIIESSVGEARLDDYSPLAARGGATTISVEFPKGALGPGPMRVTSSDPSVLAVPENVAMTVGATTATFEAIGIQRGNATVRIELPLYYHNQILQAPVSVYEVHAPVLTPAAIAVEAGSAVRVKLAAMPLSEDDVRATLSIADRSIASTEDAVTVSRGGAATFDVAGVRPGQTELVITFEPAAGGTTLRVPILVTDGKTRQRGARH